MTHCSSQSIRYNMQNNTYYRVDKQTGEKVASYLNGSTIPTFKPQITGFEYKKRAKVWWMDKQSIGKDRVKGYWSSHHQSSASKVQELGSMAKRKFLQPRRYGVAEQKNPNKGMYKTLDGHNASSTSKKGKNYLILKKQTKHSFGETLNHSQMGSISNFYVTHTPELVATSISTQAISIDRRLVQDKSEFSDSIKKFTKIQESRVRLNNSPRKDLQGSVEGRSRLQNLCITCSSFQREEPSIGTGKQKIPPGITRYLQQRKLILPDSLRIDNQVKRDRHLFYQLRPDLVSHERQKQMSAQKSMNEQKDRRSNLIKLEKLALEQSNRKTMKIFESTKES